MTNGSDAIKKITSILNATLVFCTNSFVLEWSVLGSYTPRYTVLPTSGTLHSHSCNLSSFIHSLETCGAREPCSLNQVKVHSKSETICPAKSHSQDDTANESKLSYLDDVMSHNEFTTL